MDYQNDVDMASYMADYVHSVDMDYGAMGLGELLDLEVSHGAHYGVAGAVEMYLHYDFRYGAHELEVTPFANYAQVGAVDMRLDHALRTRDLQLEVMPLVNYAQVGVVDMRLGYALRIRVYHESLHFEVEELVAEFFLFSDSFECVGHQSPSHLEFEDQSSRRVPCDG